jgi:hypothetical protein
MPTLDATPGERKDFDLLKHRIAMRQYGSPNLGTILAAGKRAVGSIATLSS